MATSHVESRFDLTIVLAEKDTVKSPKGKEHNSNNITMTPPYPSKGNNTEEGDTQETPTESDNAEPSAKKPQHLQLSFDSCKLYGRDAQQFEMQEALLRLSCQDSKIEVVFISGGIGTGRSILAQSIEKTVESCQGSMTIGRCDRSLVGAPFAAIVQACQRFYSDALPQRGVEKMDHFRDLVLQSCNELELILLQTLGAIPPEFVTIRSKERIDLESIKWSKNLNFMERALLSFFRAAWEVCPPLAIIIEEIQWIDGDSLHFLERMVLDTATTQNLMLIATYDPKELGSSHPVSKTKQKILDLHREEKLACTQLTSTNLSLANIEKWLSDLFGRQPHGRLNELAAICETATMGTPICIRHFLSTLTSNGLISCRHSVGSSHEWQWDIETIKERYAGEPLDPLKLASPHSLMCSATKSVLTRAACLGLSFRRENLFLLWRRFNDERVESSTRMEMEETLMKEALDSVIKEGILRPVGSFRYEFSSKCIKEGFLTALSSEEREILQWESGMALLNDTDDIALADENLFLASTLLSARPVQDVRLAEHFSHMFKKSMALCAFSTAQMYAKLGIQSISSVEMWTKSKLLAVKLHAEAAEAEKSMEHIEQAEKYTNFVLENSKLSEVEKLPCHYVMFDCFGPHKALALCLRLLDAIGCHIPRGRLNRQMRLSHAVSLASQKALHGGSVADMQLVSDVKRWHQMELMDRAFISALQCGQLSCAILLTSRIVRWTVMYGIHDCSPTAFAALGVIAMHIWGDFESGRAHSIASQEMLRRLGNRSRESRSLFFINSFVYSWISPCSARLHFFQNGYHFGILNGDFEFASWHVHTFITLKLLSGKDLAEVISDCQKYLPNIESMSHNRQAFYIRMCYQACLNLSAKSPETTELVGTAFSSKEFVESADDVGLLMMSFWKSFLCLFLGEYDHGAKLALRRGNRFLKILPGNFIGFDAYIRCITLFAAAREAVTIVDGMQTDCISVTARKQQSKRYIVQAEKIRSMIDEWVAKGAINLSHVLPLLNAERASFDGTVKEEVMALYEEASAESTRHGFVFNTALCEERLSSYMYSVGDHYEAGSILRRSKARYEVWGATRKVELLDKLHNEQFDKFKSSAVMKLLKHGFSGQDISDSDSDEDDSENNHSSSTEFGATILE